MKDSSNDILRVFAENLKRIRKERNLSQEQLAAIAGLHRTYIGMLERCEKNITLINLDKIARALNIHITELIK